MVLNRRAIKANARQFLTNGQWVHLFLAGIIIEAVNYINFGTSLYVQLRNTFNAIYQTQFINVSWNMMSLIALLLLPLEVSIAGYYLGCLRGRAPGPAVCMRKQLRITATILAPCCCVGSTPCYGRCFLSSPGSSNLFPIPWRL